ncbi:MAG: Gfo/Idh/MocA family oxidoreductase [Bacteroidales bacterium]|nr:Gfo/Idh/MocA family oxidoreductase [Bacteroidales bacterium]
MVRLAAIGVGNRSGKYLRYLPGHPDSVRLVAIVEPDAVRREACRKLYGLPQEACYADADAFFAEPDRCDAVIIASPDKDHFAQAMQAIDRGYHVLLEKPVAQSYQECEALKREAGQKGVKVGVCYVMRFMPVYRQVKALLDAGAIGRITGVVHQEFVGIDRMLHTYVRGYWNKAVESNPSFLSKCCHDVDALLWMTGLHIEAVQSVGGLEWYRPENAPQGSTDRCVDCPVEQKCAYSAVDMYLRRGVWTDNFPIPEGMTKQEVLEQEMRQGRYGRCAFRCGNDVADRQVVTMKSREGALVSVEMNTFTRREGRKTVFSGTEGEMTVDGWMIEVRDHRGGTLRRYDYRSDAQRPLHANADLDIVGDFIEAVADPTRQPAVTIADALESHRICFLAG